VARVDTIVLGAGIVEGKKILPAAFPSSSSALLHVALDQARAGQAGKSEE
jgi:hypothetical protein